MMLYRRALYLACGGSKEKVEDFIALALDDFCKRAKDDA